MPPQTQHAQLPQYCTAFVAEVRRFYPHAGEVQRFSDALGDFINWSMQRPQALRRNDTGTDLKVVSFARVSDGSIFWAASPRRGDIATFDIMPRAHSKLSPEARLDALELIRSISSETIADDAALRIPFLALKNAESRRKLLELLGRLLDGTPKS